MQQPPRATPSGARPDLIGSPPVRAGVGDLTVLSELLPGVAVAQTFEDDLDEPLYPAEEAVISRAVDKRRNEFRTVRACARRALGELGIRRPPLVPGTRGAPSWPPGIVGSMTHCAGYRAAAVARERDVRSLGIDAEPALHLPAGVLDIVAGAEEVEHVRALLREVPEIAWDRLLFSAKESVYKTWYPLTRRWLGFEEVVVRLGLDGSFTAALPVPGLHVDGLSIDELVGRWTASRRFVLTAVLLLPQGPAPR